MTEKKLAAELMSANKEEALLKEELGAVKENFPKPRKGLQVQEREWSQNPVQKV